MRVDGENNTIGRYRAYSNNQYYAVISKSHRTESESSESESESESWQTRTRLLLASCTGAEFAKLLRKIFVQISFPIGKYAHFRSFSGKRLWKMFPARYWERIRHGRGSSFRNPNQPNPSFLQPNPTHWKLNIPDLTQPIDDKYSVAYHHKCNCTKYSNPKQIHWKTIVMCTL